MILGILLLAISYYLDELVIESYSGTPGWLIILSAISYPLPIAGFVLALLGYGAEPNRFSS